LVAVHRHPWLTSWATARELRKLLIALAGAAALAFVVLAYTPARRAAFVWDDHALVEADASYRHASVRDLMRQSYWPDSPLTDARTAYYRPLVLLSFRFDHALDDGPGGFHLTNVLLHVLACALLGATARRLGATAPAAVLAALVWGVFPRLTESVAWISGRTDVLATVLGLGALLVTPAASRQETHSWRTWLLASVSGVLLLAALLAKEVALAVAVPIVVLAAVPRERARLARLVPNVVLPVAAYFALRVHALAGRSASGRELGVLRRVASILEAAGHYLEMVVDPLRPRTSIGLLGHVDLLRAGLGMVLFAVVILGARRLSRTAPGVRAGLALAAGALALVLHVVPLALGGAVAADRLLYLPLAGVAIATAVALSNTRPPIRTFAAATACLAAVLFGAATRARAADYTDEVRFWIKASEDAHPLNTMPRRALASVVKEGGDLDLGCRLYARSATILATSDPPLASAYNRTRENLANCWAESGRYEEAAQLTEVLARELPRSARVQMELGFARLHRLDFDGAAAALADALRLDPALLPYVGEVVRDLPSLREDARRFSEVAARDEAPLAYADYLRRVGRLREAEAAFLAVALADPTSSDAKRALGYLSQNGTVQVADRAFRAVEPSPPASLLYRHRIAARAARRAGIDAFRHRIELLT
jgi:Flp pilus assembly protein TadD